MYKRQVKNSHFRPDSFFSDVGACRVMHEKRKKKLIPPQKTFKISKKTSPKTPDTVKTPYKHNDTDLWDRGSNTRACFLPMRPADAWCQSKPHDGSTTSNPRSRHERNASRPLYGCLGKPQLHCTALHRMTISRSTLLQPCHCCKKQVQV